MFPSGASNSQELSCGSDGSVLIPTRFVWPHGGRRVFLTGSFTRWSDHLPMSPMEDSPTAFQAICNLTPGSHQYKFYVDGEWRHDENQNHESSNYGIVNSLVITGVPDSGSRDNMEVDKVNLSGGSIPDSAHGISEAAHGISEADIKISRNQISIFLSTNTSYDLLPDSGKVIALDVNLPVKQAFHILYEQGIPVAPLWHMGQFVGMLSALDFILILRELGNHGSNLTEEELETHTISAWKLGKRQRYGPLDVHGGPIESYFVHAGPYDTLMDVAIKILRNEVATVPIIHSLSPDGSFPQLLHLASLSGILECICRYFKHSSSLPILKQPICDIPLGSWVPKIGEANRHPLAKLRPNALLGSALSLLVQARVSSILIVDENDSLLDTYSRSDITALAKDRTYAQIRLDEMTIGQALQLAQDANSLHGVTSGRRCHVCFRSDSLEKVMEQLSSPGVRRVIVVEAESRRVQGIISLSDLFKFLLG